MIFIDKGRGPASLIGYKHDLNASFDNLPSEIKTEIRNSLLKEQGYLCAYCMRRIEDPSEIKIEHYVARNSENELDYKNLLAVCKGNEGSRKENQTCDTKKGSEVLHINPQKNADILTISYTRNGIIKSSNEVYQQDIDNILNLNDKNGYLIAARKGAIKAIQKNIARKSKRDIKKLYEQLTDLEKK